MEKQGFPFESFHTDAVMQKFLKRAIHSFSSLRSCVTVWGDADCHHMRFLAFWLQGVLFLSGSLVGTQPSGMSLGGRSHQPRPGLHVWLTTEMCCPEDLLPPKNKGCRIQYGEVIIDSELSGWKILAHLNGEKKAKFSGYCLGTS